MKELMSKQLGEPNVDDPACRVWTDGTPPIYHNLKEIRKRIDSIDEQIRFLLGQRLTLTNDATRFKRNGDEVPAPARQREVIAKAVNRARESEDLYPTGYVDLVEATSRIVMTTCIRLQAEAMWRTDPIA